MIFTALLFGLLGSFHCIGMCGPIAFLLPVNRSNSWIRFLQTLSYHLGRISSYTLIGLLFGFLGKGIHLFGMQQQISIIVGVLMIVSVLLPYKFINKLNFSKPIYQAVSKVKSAIGGALKDRSPETFFYIGFLNGFLPCGLVYMAVFAALTSGNILSGGLYMAMFGLGTIPLMTTAIFLGNSIPKNFKTKILKVIPVFIVLIGCLFILRGMGLGIPYISPKPIVDPVMANFSCH